MNKPIKSTDRGDQTRSALIKAALAEFADKGFHAASTRLIAQSAQVNQALIGYHFGSKEGLYLAVLEKAYRKTRSLEADLQLAELPPEEALRCSR